MGNDRLDGLRPLKKGVQRGAVQKGSVGVELNRSQPREPDYEIAPGPRPVPGRSCVRRGRGYLAVTRRPPRTWPTATGLLTTSPLASKAMLPETPSKAGRPPARPTVSR